MVTTPLYVLDPKDPIARACQRCGMRSVALFGVLDEVMHADVHLHITQIELQPGEALFKVGQEGEPVYTLREGFVRFERATAGGARRIVRLAASGDLLGHGLVLAGRHDGLDEEDALYAQVSDWLDRNVPAAPPACAPRPQP